MGISREVKHALESAYMYSKENRIFIFRNIYSTLVLEMSLNGASIYNDPSKKIYYKGKEVCPVLSKRDVQK